MNLKNVFLLCLLIVFKLKCTLAQQQTCFVIQDNDGTLQPCVFPFEYKRQLFYNCTTLDDPQENLWCSTNVDSMGRHIKSKGYWGKCEPKCFMTEMDDDSTTTTTSTSTTTTSTSSSTSTSTSHPGLDSTETKSSIIMPQVKIRSGPNRDNDTENSECGQNIYLSERKCETCHVAGPVNSPNNPTGDWPWMASIGFYNGRKWTHLCGGTLVSRKYILTAAHCGKTNNESLLNFNGLIVKLGVKDIELERIYLDAEIRSVSIHPSYKYGESYFDVALLEIDQVQFTKKLRPVCLPRFPSTSINKYEHDSVSITGWGSNDLHGKISSTLKRTQISIHQMSYCNGTHSKPDVSTEIQNRIKAALPKLFQSHLLCAGFEVGSIGSCKGDSGGPLVLFDEDRYTQIAIVQGAIQMCGDRLFPGIYVRLDDPAIFGFLSIFLSKPGIKETFIKYPKTDLYERLHYEGDIIKGLAWGTGNLTYKNGNVYAGEMQNDLPHGNGTLVYAENDEQERSEYVGFWSQNQQMGEGKLTYRNGKIYDGTFNKNKREGYGELMFEEENPIYSYKGTFLKNLIHGHGKLIMKNGEEFEGFFRREEKIGCGILKYPDGREYRGEFTNDNVTGIGILYYKNGARYEGEFEMSNRSGFGVYWYPEGDSRIRYEGNFVDDKPQGNGTLYFRSLELLKGYFENGEPLEVKQYFVTTNEEAGSLLDQIDFPEPWASKFEWKNNTYEGEVINGKAWGKGVLTLYNGNIYGGYFLNGLPHGNGTWLYPKDDSIVKFEGEFCQNYREGFGRLDLSNSGYTEGYYLRDKKEGFTFEHFPKTDVRLKGESLYFQGNLMLGTSFRRNGEFFHGFTDEFGLPDTYGYFRSEDGKEYVGEINKNEDFVQGNLVYPNEIEFQGSFKENKESGFGITLFAETDVRERFEGEYNEKTETQIGTLFYKDGKVYIGYLKNILPHGVGTQFSADGEILHQGDWDKDQDYPD